MRPTPREGESGCFSSFSPGARSGSCGKKGARVPPAVGPHACAGASGHMRGNPHDAPHGAGTTLARLSAEQPPPTPDSGGKRPDVPRAHSAPFTVQGAFWESLASTGEGGESQNEMASDKGKQELS